MNDTNVKINPQVTLECIQKLFINIITDVITIGSGIIVGYILKCIFV